MTIASRIWETCSVTLCASFEQCGTVCAEERRSKWRKQEGSEMGNDWTLNIRIWIALVRDGRATQYFNSSLTRWVIIENGGKHSGESTVRKKILSLKNSGFSFY